MTDYLVSGPSQAGSVLLLAHGAGAAMTSPFLEQMAALLAEQGLGVMRFEFAYMAARRAGKRRPPPRAESLMDEYRAVIAETRAGLRKQQRLFAGGKSLGGRVASLIAQEAFGSGNIAGLVCLGYPFHPPGKPEQLRTAHLKDLTCPTLVIQGERDPFGSKAEVEGYGLAKAIRIDWVGDGDHDFGPRGASGFTRKGNLARAASLTAAFAQAPDPGRFDANASAT